MKFSNCHKTIAVLLLLLAAMSALASTAAQKLHAAARAPAFSGSKTCAGCHREATEAWKASHHAWAWRDPTAESVLGNFADTGFTHQGITSRFSTRQGRYFIETDGPDGKLEAFEVKYTAGVEPLQQYLVETAPGRLQALDIAWDTERRRWYHLYPDQQLEADNGLHWTGPYKNWNARCAECHATGFEKNYDPRTMTYASRQAEKGVTCEACHGPGEAHVSWAQSPGSFDHGAWRAVNGLGLAFAFDPDDAGKEVELCAACHARRGPLGDASPLPGTAFADSYRLAVLRDGLYHPDGQILDEVYVYGSFLQSKMHAGGVRCTNCHEPHSGNLIAAANAVCAQCHSPSGNPSFPTLRKASYDAPAHHFHEAGTAGAQCAGCHMPERNYMVVDGRRDHSFRVPRPDLSVKLGTPNACTLCHRDKSDSWAARQVETWYPDGRGGSPHYAEALSAVRAGDPLATVRLLKLAVDHTRPAIVRATALDLLRSHDPSSANAVTDLLSDPGPLVRGAAAGLQERAPPRARVARLQPLLSDPRRTVRIEAARALVDVPSQFVPRESLLALRSATAEYQASLLATADFPETQMNIAGLASRTGNPDAAQAALRAALRLDPYLVEGWINLGVLQQAAGRTREAETSLRSGLAKLPQSGALYNTLGLLYAERGNYGDAAKSLQRAAELMPDDVRVRYNLSLSLERSGQGDAAEAAMRAALDLDPDDPDILYGLAFQLLNRKRLDEARSLADRLLQQDPNRPEARQLLEEITRQQQKP
jgi:tetratricopeptide (TPR) repeat protein